MVVVERKDISDPKDGTCAGQKTLAFFVSEAFFRPSNAHHEKKAHHHKYRCT